MCRRSSSPSDHERTSLIKLCVSRWASSDISAGEQSFSINGFGIVSTLSPKGTR
jgi:hypothetical protein